MLGVALLGAYFFAEQMVQNVHDLCAGADENGSMNDFDWSYLLGETTIGTASLGFSKMPFMNVGKGNVKGYFNQSPRGRLRYEHNAHFQKNYSEGNPQSFNLKNWDLKGAFSKQALGTGPTPGGRVGVQCGRNFSLGGELYGEGYPGSGQSTLNVTGNPYNDLLPEQ